MTDKLTHWLVVDACRISGHTDAIDSGLPRDSDVSAERIVERIANQHLEGINRMMQNKREHGSHPIRAFEHTVDVTDAPYHVEERLAQSEHDRVANVVDPGAEWEEYRDYLAENYEIET